MAKQRVYDKINYQTNFTDPKTFAILLRAINERGIVESQDARKNIFPQARSSAGMRYNPDNSDTHGEITLDQYGLIEYERKGHFKLSPLGKRFLELFDNDNKVKTDNEYNYVNTMLDAFLSWKDNSYGRNIKVGYLIINLMLEDDLNRYLTDEEWAFIAEHSGIKDDSEYINLKDRLCDRRLKTEKVDLKKADVLFSGYANKWKIFSMKEVDDERRYSLSEIAKEIIMTKIDEIKFLKINNKFSWIKIYKEFAIVLLNYRSQRENLLDKIKTVFNNLGLKNPFVHNEKELVDVCPFTIFGTFNRGLTDENRINILKQIKVLFSLESDVPSDFYGIPVLNNQQSWFFTHEDGLTKFENGTIDLLWNLFETSLKYAADSHEDDEKQFIKLFDKVISKKLIKWNITMGLFWIKPDFYINLDSITRQYLSYLNLNGLNYNEIFKSMINGQEYIELLKSIKNSIKDNIIQEKSLYEISYNAWDFKNEVNDDETKNEETLSMTEYQFKSSIQNGENRVVYGTPGCGKSYYVQNTLLNGYLEENVIRTTFYQDYTNTDFVGQILPVIESDKSVSYEFIPGPFSIALTKALEKPEEQVALVVEELNRGNAASIFGDIFQLLDRETSGENKSRSIYSITNVNLQKYLTKELKFIFNKIMIPSNLSIFATMNTSDQNVFTLDTAFKRRWKFEKLSNKFEDYKELYGEEHPFKDDFIPGMIETWKDFVDKINKAILDEVDITKSEDKQLGIFFIDETGLVKKELVDVDNNIVTDENKNEKVKEFAYKIFEYLWDDVLKYCRENWFGKEIKSLDDLIKEYIKKADKNEGAEVFVNGIIKENK